MHQLINTNDVSHDNWFTRWVMGCSAVSHVFYPAITRILREEVEENGLPYRSYPLITTLINHYRLLKQNRQAENIFDEAL